MDDQRRQPWLSLGCLGAFVVLTVLVAAGGPVDRLDRAVQRLLDAHRDPTLTAAARHLTDVLSPAVDVAVLALGGAAMAWRSRRAAPFLTAAAGGLLLAAVTLTVKHVVARPAPVPTAAPTHGGSFPSGHTAAALVCLGTLALLVSRRRPALARVLYVAVALVTLVVAAALVYDNYHWLTDTVGSILFGAALLGLLRRRLSR